MNRKQLITLLVLVVLIGGACLLLIRNQNKSWEGANPALGKKLLGEFPVNDVSHIVIKQGTNELNLANKDVFKIEKARSVAVTFPNATNSWKLSRDTETAEWKLAETKPGEQLDSTKASGVANPFSSASFVDLRTNSSSEVMDKSIVVETFDNFSYTVKVGPKTNDNYPLAMSVSAQLLKERTAGKDEKPEDKDKLDKEFKDKQKKLEEKLAQEKTFENWVYLVSSWTVDPLLKERSQLMVEKKEEPKKEEKGAAAEPAGASELKKDETPPATPPAPAPELPKKAETQKAESSAAPPETQP